MRKLVHQFCLKILECLLAIGDQSVNCFLGFMQVILGLDAKLRYLTLGQKIVYSVR